LIASPRLRRLARVTALLGGAALVVTACSSAGTGTGTAGQSSSSNASSSTAAPSTSAVATTSAAPKPSTPVHVSLKLSDGSQVGVGMPIIAFFSRPIVTAKAFAGATKVTVNDKPVTGAWYCEEYTSKATPIECDWRMEGYWPAHAHIHMDLPVNGLSAGPGLAFNDSLTSDFSTGPANIATVDDSTHKLTLVSDGVTEGVYPVSLGASDTPTAHGVKVIMEKGASICMSGPGYHICNVQYTQRLTYGGEYLHAAPWNTSHIAHGIDSSNGCTNLTTADAKKLYGLLEIGDVVDYPNANGPHMTMGAGYGDWNVPWGQWLTGGLYATS
jgi:lipoprotein-anchoring transpeptidase ErfK/SrfK